MNTPLQTLELTLMGLRRQGHSDPKYLYHASQAIKELRDLNEHLRQHPEDAADST